MPESALPAFALAKIQPPRPRLGLVERPQLESALGAALLEHRLTLLVAPAGYGKTAALTRQIRQLPAGCALAWVSADEDDQLQRFLACLTTALEPHDLPWRVAPEALATLALADRGVRDVAREVVNALAAAEVARGLIVVDDVHRVADPQVYELLQHMLDRLPDHWGMAVASRVEPPLALARLRAAGELAEFQRDDLRFSEAEVGALIASVASGASGAPEPGSARELLQRTDGWAAGLRLSLTARQPAARAGAGRGAQRHLFEYLAAEVLDDMPAELRGFLLRSSVLPELSAARCARVNGVAAGVAARLLEQTERRGLFVSVLDADELTLRLHDLFRDFLEDRLQRDHADELPQLLRRAAEGEPDLQRAVGWLARAGAWDEAAQSLAAHGPALIAAGGGPSVEQMLALFPAEQFERRPELHFLRGLAAFPCFDFDELYESMRRAAEGYERAARARDATLARGYLCLGMQNTGRLAEADRELARLRGLAQDDAVRALVYFASAWAAYASARTEGVAPMAAAMIDALERGPDPQAWDRCSFLSLFAGLPGLRPLLERFADGAMRVTAEKPSQLRAGVFHLRAGLALEAGRIDEAMRWLARADDDCRWLGRPRSVMTENWMAHSLVDALRGDREASYAAALENRRDLEQESKTSNRRTHEYEELFTLGRAAWLLGDEAALRETAAAMARAANPYEWTAADDDRRFMDALLALLDGRLEDALEGLAPLAHEVERSCFHPSTQARVMLADVQLRLGRVDEAAGTLKPWLGVARRGEHRGGALLAGMQTLDRLASAAWGGRLDAEEREVLGQLRAHLAQLRAAVADGAPTGEAAPDSAGRSAPTGARPAAPLSGTADAWSPDPGIASLSQREREVLARMAAGDSNKLIARAFDLSPHTVKRHVANILGKLGVETRGQAAARWRGNGAR